MPYTYILQCSDGSYYTGSTIDLTKRVAEHEAGIGAKHTAARRPVQLVYAEFHQRVETAFEREQTIKGWSRKKKEALIHDAPELLASLSLRHQTDGG